MGYQKRRQHPPVVPLRRACGVSGISGDPLTDRARFDLVLKAGACSRKMSLNGIERQGSAPAHAAAQKFEPRISPRNWRSRPKLCIVSLKLPMASGPMSASTGPALYEVLRSSMTSALPGESSGGLKYQLTLSAGLRRIVGHGEEGPLADLEPAGRTVVLNRVGPLVHRQAQPAVRVADEVDAGAVVVETEDDPVAAAADLEAFGLEPAQDREGAQAAQIIQRARRRPAPSPRARRRGGGASRCRSAVRCRAASAPASRPAATPARTIGSSAFRSTAICTNERALPPSASVTVRVTE